jgi:DNA repair exonuclease SbcCD nuclease subunit
MPKSTKSRNADTVTFIHTADWQLGKPFASITDPVKRARVQQERFEAIRRIGAVVRDRQARFVVVAGDLFDSPTPTHATISAALGAIAEIGVPVFAIPGNHDHAGPDSLWEQPFFKRERNRLAPDFHLLSSREPRVVALCDRGDGPYDVVLLPCPLLRRREPDDPTAWLRDLDYDELGDRPRIVIAHGSTTAFTAAGSARHDDENGPDGPVNTIAIERLPLDEIDYIALGDWHGFMNVHPKAWYSGTPEIDRFPKTDQKPGHVTCVTIGRGMPPAVATIRTGRFRWLVQQLSLETSLSEGNYGSDTPHTQGPSHFDDCLTQATRPQAAGEPGFDGCLARIAISGTVSLAGRAELVRSIESWQARLLRLDIEDTVRLAPSANEIHDLAARPDDPIISRVAAELLRRLAAGQSAADTPGTDIDVICHAISMVHALVHPEVAAASTTTAPRDLHVATPTITPVGAQS